MLSILRRYFILLLLNFFCLTTFGQTNSLADLLKNHTSNEVPFISVQELAMPKTKSIILDSREIEEYNVSHIDHSLHVGYNDFNLQHVMKQIPDKDNMIVVYCSLGIRSETIGKKLIEAGYTNVYNLYGGIFEWKNHGFPVVDNQGKTTNRVHAFSNYWSKWLVNGEKVFSKN